MLGRYSLVTRLGAGAMGVVWAAQDPRLDRRVAIKVVHPKLARTPEASARLLREARAMAKLSHRSVVTVHDAGEVDGRLYIAMELVEGTTLGQLLKSRAASDLDDWKRWLALVTDAGRGLAAAHRMGVLHRDFKPDNVLVDRDGRACVADFGLASLGGDTEAQAKALRDSTPLDLTRTGMLLGTPVYMSPQQLRGEPVDERADQFAFCVTAWEALYGSRPFGTELKGLAAIAELASTIELSGVTPPPTTSPVPARVREAIVRGLAADPEKRWPNMDALVDALAGGTKRKRRRALPWAVSGVLGIAVGGGVIAAMLGSDRERKPEPPAVVASPATPPKKLFAVPLRTRLALTPNGKRVALGGSRVEVRDVDGAGYWSAALSDPTELSAVEVTDDVMYFAYRNNTGVWTWHYRTDAAPEPPTESFPGQWYGHCARGHVIYVPGEHPSVRIIDHGTEVSKWDVMRDLEVLAVSPDGTRVAYFDGYRFEQRLVIRNVVSGRDFTIGPDATFTALAWRDDATLLYAVGTVDKPTIYQVPLTATAVGKPVALHQLESGWIGSLAATRDRVMYVEMGLSSRTRVLERPTLASRDFDAAGVAAPLAWIAPDVFLAWNRGSHRVERHSVNAPMGTTGIVLPTEPANATIAGDVLIASLRVNEGRSTVAFSLATGKQLWKAPDAKTFVVRCEADTRAPCFAVRLGTGSDRIYRIDPQTGALGDVVYESERIEDVAIDQGGTHLVITSAQHHSFTDLDLTGASTTASRSVPLTSTRSVAIDYDGQVLATGTLVKNTYQAGHVAADGTWSVLAQTENDILSMIRPSVDGRRILLLSRNYSPWLYLVP
jgi:tRNA A-37 threonylcarbamoyl transferase component Bud32